MRFKGVIAFLVSTLLVTGVSSAHSDPIDFSSLPTADHDLARRAIAVMSHEYRGLPIEIGDSEGHEHSLCGTFGALELRTEVSYASKLTQHALATLFQRPRHALSMVSPSGRFLVHYDLDGFHAVDPTDADRSGHPDYVDEAGKAFDEAWEHIVDQLGYTPPPSDGDGLFDICVRDLSPTGRYGATYPETLSLTLPSYIEIDNNFTDPVYVTFGLDALRFTAAHEFFHSVQFGYYLSIEATWWYELTATWMQDEVFTEVNDHYSLVNAYLGFPEAAMYEQPPITLRPYGAMILGVHLASVYGEATIRETFEDLAARSPNPYTITDSDQGFPGGFAGVLPRYWIWNYFTGSRAQGSRYYAEASAYQEVSAQEITPIGSLTLGGASQVQGMGASYARVNTGGKTGGLEVSFTLPSGPTWNLDVLLVKGSGFELIHPQGTTVTIPNAGDYDEVVFIPSVLSLGAQIYDLSYSVRMAASVTAWSDRVADFDHNGEVGFEDFIVFADSFGQAAESQNSHTDPNSDGRVDFEDFLVFACHFGEGD